MSVAMDAGRCVFRQQDDLFVPTNDALSPWGADRLHGGPVLGLLTRSLERAVSDPAFVLARLTTDLFRAPPVQPLAVEHAVLKQSRRLILLSASLRAEGVEVVRASALFLRNADEPAPSEQNAGLPTPPGPEGLETTPLMRGFRPEGGAVAPGFHTMIETRWVDDGERPAIWFRLPIPLVEGETPSTLQCAASLSDFANAVASISARQRGRRDTTYINSDATLHLVRRPEGEWFCLAEASRAEHRGLSVAEMALFDREGHVGRVLQSRLRADFRR
jgi:hypothetical protein